MIEIRMLLATIILMIGTYNESGKVDEGIKNSSKDLNTIVCINKQVGKGDATKNLEMLLMDETMSP